MRGLLSFSSCFSLNWLRDNWCVSNVFGLYIMTSVLFCFFQLFFTVNSWVWWEGSDRSDKGFSHRGRPGWLSVASNQSVSPLAHSPWLAYLMSPRALTTATILMSTNYSYMYSGFWPPPQNKPKCFCVIRPDRTEQNRDDNQRNHPVDKEPFALLSPHSVGFKYLLNIYLD